MKLAQLLSIITLNLGGRFCTSTFTSKFLTSFLNVHTKEKEYVLCFVSTLYANASNHTPFYTHFSLYVGLKCL
jgi:hypothetical protein